MKTNSKNILSFILALLSASAVFAAATPTPNQAGRIHMVREVGFFLANYCVMVASGPTGMVNGVNYGAKDVSPEQSRRISANFTSFDISNKSLTNKSQTIVDRAFATAGMTSAAKNLATRAVSKVMNNILKYKNTAVVCANADAQLEVLASYDYTDSDPAYLAREFEGFKLDETLGLSYNQIVTN